MPDDNQLKNPKVLARLRRLKERLGREGAWTLTDRHELGRAAHAAFDAETGLGREKYGRQVMSHIAQALGLKRSLLYKVVRIANWLTPEEAKELSGQARPKGECVSWSLVRASLAVDDLPKRRELLEQAIAGGWTSGRLAEEVRKWRGGKPRGGGPRPVRPRDLGDLVGMMRRAPEEFANRSRQGWSGPGASLTEKAAALGSEQITQELVARLDELKEKLAAVRKETLKREAEVERVVEDLKGKLGRRKR